MVVGIELLGKPGLPTKSIFERALIPLRAAIPNPLRVLKNVYL